MSDAEAPTSAAERAGSDSGKGGCARLLLLVAGVVLVIHLADLGFQRVGLWLAPQGTEALVPFQAGFLRLGTAFLCTDGDTFTTRVIAFGAFTLVAGFILALLSLILRRPLGEARQARITAALGRMTAFAALVLVPLAALFLPRGVTVLDLETRRLVREQAVPFSAIEGIGHRRTSENFRGGNYEYVELVAVLREPDEKLRPVVIGRARIRGGELDVTAYFSSDEARAARAASLGDAATATLARLTGARDLGGAKP
jgi:hypothetical protein